MKPARAAFEHFYPNSAGKLLRFFRHREIGHLRRDSLAVVGVEQIWGLRRGEAAFMG
jgi:hypothetical protein